MSTNILVTRRLSDNFSPLIEHAIRDLSAILIRKELKKNQVYLKEGGVHENIIYIDSGLLRFYYHKKRKEVTVHFGGADSFAICDESYFHKNPSHLTVTALEPTVVYEIPRDNFMELVNKHPDIEILYRRILESLLLESRNKISSFRFENAQERYLSLITQRPDLIKRVPLGYIASYLLMSKETLSRVRTGLSTLNN
ncbi:MAG: Crp/Fnr family transcriptional regulator [Tannerellaceae bacterium]|nr:Crp/Fnr family transcriptional regulator [Tannerellaceae bacterium]